MVTGIGYCGRIGRRKREKHIHELCNHPERFHFYSLPSKKLRKYVIIDRNGDKTVRRL